MSRTNTAPWDYDRNAVFTPEEQARHKAIRTAIQNAQKQLIGIMGVVAFRQWKLYDLDLGEQSGEKFLIAMDHQLERFECSCTPRVDPCQGCRLRNSYQNRS